MIIVTGGAGFIGSNIVAGLNRRGLSDILIVDDLRDGQKMHNLADLDFRDYLDKDEFLEKIESGRPMGAIEAVVHQGACSATTEWDGQFLMRNNFGYSKSLLHWCQKHGVPFLYASSASVYGDGSRGFREDRACERPINMYAFSKFQFDQYVRGMKGGLVSQVVGLRYFNVYGPGEAHKGAMASTIFHFDKQLATSGTVRLFAGCDGYADGEQRRDFIHVDDCVSVNLWFLDHPDRSGIFNVGTGQAAAFNEVAQATIDWHATRGAPRGRIEYIPFPEHLAGAYQSFTQADLGRLREVGYPSEFLHIRSGIPRYLESLQGPTDGGQASGRH